MKIFLSWVHFFGRCKLTFLTVQKISRKETTTTFNGRIFTMFITEIMIHCENVSILSSPAKIFSMRRGRRFLIQRLVFTVATLMILSGPGYVAIIRCLQLRNHHKLRVPISMHRLGIEFQFTASCFWCILMMDDSLVLLYMNYLIKLWFGFIMLYEFIFLDSSTPFSYICIFEKEEKEIEEQYENPSITGMTKAQITI